MWSSADAEPTAKGVRCRPAPVQLARRLCDEQARARAVYAPQTINRQLGVLAGFYGWAITAGPGPVVNPQRTHGRRTHAHHNPAEDFPTRRRAPYRQKVPFEG
jgi:hypothetical protein